MKTLFALIALICLIMSISERINALRAEGMVCALKAHVEAMARTRGHINPAYVCKMR